MSWLSIQDKLYDWVLTYSGLNPIIDQEQILWADNKGAQPSPTFITLKVIAIKRATNDELRSIGITNFLVSGLREFTLSVNFYGKDGLDYADNLQSSLGIPAVRELLKTEDIAFIRTADILDTSVLVNTKIGTRYTLDVSFYTASNVSITEDIISNVEMTGSIQDEEGNVREIDLEVNE